MSADRRAFLGSGLALLAGAAAAQDYKDPAIVAAEANPPRWPSKERFPLWPGRPPGAPAAALPRAQWTMSGDATYRQLWIKGIPTPEVHVFRPRRTDGSCLLVIPGGGYEFLAVQNEGIDAAQRFTAERTTVFALTYRLPAEGWANRHVAPLQDAQRAMRLIRSRASEWSIDPLRLGVLGFSAGGHLAADLSTSFQEQTYAPLDAADQISTRPAFAGLIYPILTLEIGMGHIASRDNLLGPNPSADVIRARSPIRHIRRDAPPYFLVHAMDDTTVTVANSISWMMACQAAEIAAETHLFTEGGHGFGFHLTPDMPAARWPELFALWLRKHGG